MGPGEEVLPSHRCGQIMGRRECVEGVGKAAKKASVTNESASSKIKDFEVSKKMPIPHKTPFSPLAATALLAISEFGIIP